MKRFLGYAGLLIVDILITSYATIWMWNTIVVGIFNTQKISIMQGWALGFAIMYFIKGRIKKDEDFDVISELIKDILFTLWTWGIAAIICVFAF